MYLLRPSNNTRTATILFFALCLLYVLSAATLVDDLVTNILVKVRKQFLSVLLRKKKFFNQLCRSVSAAIYYRKLICSHFYFALLLSRFQQAVVATSSPNVS